MKKKDLELLYAFAEFVEAEAHDSSSGKEAFQWGTFKTDTAVQLKALADQFDAQA